MKQRGFVVVEEGIVVTNDNLLNQPKLFELSCEQIEDITISLQDIMDKEFEFAGTLSAHAHLSLAPKHLKIILQALLADKYKLDFAKNERGVFN